MLSWDVHLSNLIKKRRMKSLYLVRILVYMPSTKRICLLADDLFRHIPIPCLQFVFVKYRFLCQMYCNKVDWNVKKYESRNFHVIYVFYKKIKVLAFCNCAKISYLQRSTHFETYLCLYCIQLEAYNQMYN